MARFDGGLSQFNQPLEHLFSSVEHLDSSFEQIHTQKCIGNAIQIIGKAVSIGIARGQIDCSITIRERKVDRGRFEAVPGTLNIGISMVVSKS
eukprot:scaffold215518_cov17-Cyclotella_meneghiniana.AAC.1